MTSFMDRSSSARSPIDQHIGERLRMRRTCMGLSQSAVASSLGLTFQQIQKYENGSNGLSASRLHQLAEILECPVSFFFDGLGAPAVAGPAPQTVDVEFVQAYADIRNPAKRRALRELINALASETE